MRRVQQPLAALTIGVLFAGGVLSEFPGLLALQRFRSGVDILVLTATVTDREGRLIFGLDRDDFVVYEDGVERPVAQFTRDRVPVSLGILVDVSDSMYGQRMADARRAIDRFVLDLLEPEDEAFLMVFNHRPEPPTPWTRPTSSLAGRLDAVKPFGGTAIYDAIVRGTSMLSDRRHQRCAIVVVSDGDDTASDATLQEARQAVNRTDAFLYAIALDPPPAGPAIARRFSPGALTEISSQTGGYIEVIHKSEELLSATERIATELNHQYTLAIVPTHSDGQYHSIHVRTRAGDHLVRSRRGYLAVPPVSR
jgi:Ca-activated chloride channel homolog